MENTLSSSISKITTLGSVSVDYGTTTNLNAKLSEIGSPLIPVHTDNPVEDLSKYVLDTHDKEVYQFMSIDLWYGSWLCKKGLLQFLRGEDTYLAELMTHVMPDIMNQRGLWEVSEYIDGMRMTFGFRDFDGFYNKLSVLGVEHSLVYYSQCPLDIRHKLIDEVTTQMCTDIHVLSRTLTGSNSSPHVAAVLVCVALTKCLSLSSSIDNYKEMFNRICSAYALTISRSGKINVVSTLASSIYPRVLGYRSLTPFYRTQICRALIEAEELFDISLGNMIADSNSRVVSSALSRLFAADV